MRFSALILAGGRSLRMGRDKAWLRVQTESLLERQVRLAREAGAGEVLVSGRHGVDYAAVRCPVLIDKVADAGPLGGIERGLDSASTEMLLVLAVDLPLLSTACLLRVASLCRNGGAIPVIEGRLQPLAAFYPRSARELASAQLQTDAKAASLFAERCMASGLARFVTLDSNQGVNFTNWNSPADLKTALPR